MTASTFASSGRPSQGRQLPFAAVLGGAVFLTLATALTIAALRAATDASRRAETLIANLESTVWAARNGTAVGLLFIDLDAFKDINDTTGHLAGDGALAEIAARMKRSVRADAVVARLGGDEFAILLEDLTGPDGASVVAERVAQAVERQLRIGATEYRVGASTGIAISTDGIATADDLLAAADRAMYAAKRAGGGRSVLFDGQAADSAVA